LQGSDAASPQALSVEAMARKHFQSNYSWFRIQGELCIERAPQKFKFVVQKILNMSESLCARVSPGPAV
jgi:hypothetical protein